jgi:hypothetical protein
MFKTLSFYNTKNEIKKILSDNVQNIWDNIYRNYTEPKALNCKKHLWGKIQNLYRVANFEFLSRVFPIVLILVHFSGIHLRLYLGFYRFILVKNYSQWDFDASFSNHAFYFQFNDIFLKHNPRTYLNYYDSPD